MKGHLGRITSLSACLALAMMFAAVSSAQEYRARIQGTVTDASNAVIPGAKVTLQNVKTTVAVIRETGPQGHYLFDLVEPGMYAVAVELEGFNKFVQENILVENRADLTINAVMNVGAVAETVTVTEAPITVKFNTTSMEITVDNDMVKNLPIQARNPFTLALLNPAVVNRYTSPRNPFFMWSASSMEFGGTQYQSSDVLLEGMPLMLGPKSSYAPPMDSVTEVDVQQNSVDAEYGHSGGGHINVATKAGTNETHGTLYYFGRNPKLNAVSNPFNHTPNRVRNHIGGGSIGHPIVKNRIFHFLAFEKWQQRDPRFLSFTLPTALERVGDFSQSLNTRGELRRIYDPWTSVLDVATNTGSRTMFANNMIPQSQLDPTAVKLMGEVWLPDRPGVGFVGTDNFRAAPNRLLDYHNITSRSDYVLNDSVKTYFRFSRFRTDLGEEDYTPNQSRIFSNANAGAMHALNISGDAIFTLNPTTVINVRGSYQSNNDDYYAPDQIIGLDDLGDFWTDASFFRPYLEHLPEFYMPTLNIEGNSGPFGKGNFWYQHPENYFFSSKISKQAGRHYLKMGGEYRQLRVTASRPRTFFFNFDRKETADTFINPKTALSGDGWASFLLGALADDSSGESVPLKKDTVDFFGFFIQDDFKVNRNLTINMGLRYEYESAIYDRESYRLSRAFDLDNPIPEFQQNAPVFPEEVLGLMDRPYRFTGAWQFTDEDNPGMWNPNKLVLLPRLGAAIRLSDRTSLRIGWARYMTPSKLQRATGGILGSTPYPGFSAETPVAPTLEGIPRAVLANPFPSSGVNANPLIPLQGKSLGRYTNLGGLDAVWDKEDFRPQVNDRFNVSLQRETWNRFVVDATYFFNLGRDRPYDLEYNLMNPQLSYTHKAALNQTVDNPFFGYLTPDKFPGPLRNRQRVSIRSLLVPFPQYGDVTQVNTDGARGYYQALQLRIQRPFANGFNYLLAYNYNRERFQDFFNDDEEFAGTFRYLPPVRGRHRLTMAGTYEFPFGRGRRYGSNANAVVDAILGGWQSSFIYTYFSGNRLEFGSNMIVLGDPNSNIPGGGKDKWGYMWNPDAFEQAPAFTPRTNPRFYDKVLGPGIKNIDVSVSKFFQMTERFRLEFKMESYNMTNTFRGRDPNTSVTNSNFGRVTAMAPGTFMREFQYTARLHF